MTSLPSAAPGPSHREPTVSPENRLLTPSTSASSRSLAVRRVPRLAQPHTCPSSVPSYCDWGSAPRALIPGFHHSVCICSTRPSSHDSTLHTAPRLSPLERGLPHFQLLLRLDCPPPPETDGDTRRDEDSSSLTYPREQGKRAGEPEQPARAHG